MPNRVLYRVLILDFDWESTTKRCYRTAWCSSNTNSPRQRKTGKPRSGSEFASEDKSKTKDNPALLWEPGLP